MSHPQPAVLFLRVPAVAPDREAAYEKWYDEVHIPYRMDKPDFLGAERYDVLVGRQRYFVFYELSSVSALTSAPYLALREWEAAQPADTFEAVGRSRPVGLERGVYEQVSGPQWPSVAIEAPFAYVAGHEPAGDDELALGAWYDDVHTPNVARIPGVLAIRRFVLTRAQMGAQSGLRTDRPRCIAVYYLASESVASDPAFLREQETARGREGTAAAAPYVLLGRLVRALRARPVASSAT